MKWRSGIACLAAVLAVAAGKDGDTGTSDPFAFFRSVAALDRTDRERLDRRDLIVRIPPARDGEIAVFAALRLDASPDALVAWTRAIAQLKSGPFVQAIQRFSDPPVLQDLDGLVLEDDDVEAIRRCRSGHCDVKLLSDEIEGLRAAAGGAGEAWKDAVRREFRQVVLSRLNDYRTSDPDIATSLAGYPSIDVTDSESFFYWSKELYATAKPVIAVTQVTIIRPVGPGAPAVLVLGKEIFATHYRNASLGMTAVVQDPARNVSYLVYVNRSHVDVLGDVFGGFKRMLIEGRIRSESSDLLKRVRDRLEGGNPS